jgi:Ca2+-binding EF-hand superfamily protein
MDEKRVAAAFRAADADLSGTLDVRELSTLLWTLGVERSPAQCADLVAAADLDQSEKLSLPEVQSLFSVAKLRDAFEALDADGSGAIAASELSLALKSLGYALPPRQCASLFAKVDGNGDGTVTFDEFARFFRFVPLASLAAVGAHLVGHASVDVGTDLAPMLPAKDLPIWVGFGSHFAACYLRITSLSSPLCVPAA